MLQSRHIDTFLVPVSHKNMVAGIGLAAILLAVGTMTADAQAPIDDGAPNRDDVRPAFAAQTEAPAQQTPFGIVQTTVAEGLSAPWGIAVLPGGEGYLVTERPGDLHHVSADGTVSDPLANVPEVHAVRQGGLLDIALAPDFGQSRILYLTYAKPLGDGMSATAAARARLSEDMTTLEDVEEIFQQTPPSPTPMHYGSRVVPTEDGYVFITMGEHSSPAERDMSQAHAATYGKVVRLMPDGSVPSDNPFVDMQAAQPEIWSLGHRNPQGAALQPGTGALWVIEHGPAGGDELNLIAEGANYGWPIVTYGVNYNGTLVSNGDFAHTPEFMEPRYYWDPVIAPGGMVFYEGEMFEEWTGDILASGLVAASLVRLDMDGDTVIGEERLAEGIGRVRDVVVDLDGSILFVLDGGDASEVIRLSR